MLAKSNEYANNQQIVHDFLDLLSKKDFKAWIELWTEDVVQDMPFSPPEFPSRLEGREAIAKHYGDLPQAVGSQGLYYSEPVSDARFLY